MSKLGSSIAKPATTTAASQNKTDSTAKTTATTGTASKIGAGKGLLWREIKVSEADKLSELKDPEPVSHFIEIFELQEENKKLYKPPEGAESFDKKISEFESNATRSITHSLVILSNEIDHGKSVISESRDQLDSLRKDKENLQSCRTFPSPFFAKYIDNIEKQKTDISDAIAIFEKSLTRENFTLTPMVLVQLIESQHDAIVRCSARMADVKEHSDRLKDKIKEIAKKRNIIIDDALLYDEEDDKSSTVMQVDSAFKQFQAERKRNLEKRDRTTKFAEVCQPQKKTGLGGKGILGTNRTAKTSTNSTTTGSSNPLSKTNKGT